jgi:hypothetical protein
MSAASTESSRPDYESQALKALQKARKSMTGDDPKGSAEAEFQLASANIFATLELAAALRKSQS